jgi:hypothetical protein
MQPGVVRTVRRHTDILLADNRKGIQAVIAIQAACARVIYPEMEALKAWHVACAWHDSSTERAE